MVERLRDVVSDEVEIETSFLDSSKSSSSLKDEKALQRLTWSDLKRRVKVWCALASATEKHLDYEKSLAGEIFVNIRHNNSDASTPGTSSSSLSHADLAFARVIESSINRIVNQAKMITRSRKSPEKVFALLGMMEHYDGLNMHAHLSSPNETGLLGKLSKSLRTMKVSKPITRPRRFTGTLSMTH